MAHLAARKVNMLRSAWPAFFSGLIPPKLQYRGSLLDLINPLIDEVSMVVKFSTTFRALQFAAHLSLGTYIPARMCCFLRLFATNFLKGEVSFGGKGSKPGLPSR
jgi:hypothetical protein